MSLHLTSGSGNGTRIAFVLLVLSLIGTLASGVWWASAFTHDVETMQGEIQKNKQSSDDIGAAVFTLRERAAADDATARATEQRLNSIDNTLTRIERKIDRATRGPAQ